MKCCINNIESKKIIRTDLSCPSCLAAKLPIGMCKQLNMCNLITMIGEARNTFLIFKL